MQALFKLGKKKLYKKKIKTLIMFALYPERIFRIGNMKFLEEANAYILPQTAGR